VLHKLHLTARASIESDRRRLWLTLGVPHANGTSLVADKPINVSVSRSRLSITSIGDFMSMGRPFHPSLAKEHQEDAEKQPYFLVIRNIASSIYLYV
jgi:hypothetical protein